MTRENFYAKKNNPTGLRSMANKPNRSIEINLKFGFFRKIYKKNPNFDVNNGFKKKGLYFERHKKVILPSHTFLHPKGLAFVRITFLYQLEYNPFFNKTDLKRIHLGNE